MDSTPTYFLISSVFSFQVWIPSNVFRKFLWSHWNLMLPCFLFHFLILFQFNFRVSQLIDNLLLLYNSQRLELSSLPISTFICFKISFSFFFACIFTFLLKSSLLVLDIHAHNPFISFFNFHSLLFSSLEFFFAVSFRLFHSYFNCDKIFHCMNFICDFRDAVYNNPISTKNSTCSTFNSLVSL